MKLVLLSKLDEQAASGMRQDALVNAMIVDHVSSSRSDFVLRVAICVDGRRNPETGLDFKGRRIEDPDNMAEARNLKNLICHRIGDVPMEFVDFSFVRPAADAYEVARSCHIMLFVGYGGDPQHIESILAGLQRGSGLPDIVRSRVQYGRLWWIGMCGGAMCAGHWYRNWRGLDVLEGTTIQYEAGRNPDDLGPSQTNEDQLVLTSFAGSAIWTRREDGQKGSCFVISRKDKTRKWNWCMDNQVKLCRALDNICERWHWPTMPDGTHAGWAFRLDGWLFEDDQVKHIYPKNREDRIDDEFHLDCLD